MPPEGKSIAITYRAPDLAAKAWKEQRGLQIKGMILNALTAHQITPTAVFVDASESMSGGALGATIYVDKKTDAKTLEDLQKKLDAQLAEMVITTTRIEQLSAFQDYLVWKGEMEAALAETNKTLENLAGGLSAGLTGMEKAAALVESLQVLGPLAVRVISLLGHVAM